MSELPPDATPEPGADPAPESGVPFDFSQLRAETAESFPQSSAKPDHTKSRTKRSGRARGLLSAAKDDSPPREAPRSTRQQRQNAKAKKTVPNKKGQFIEPLTKFYTLVGMGMSATDPVCGVAIVQNAENCARSLDELAQKNEVVRRALWSLIQVSTMGAVVAAHLPIILAILMHHVPRAREAFGEGLGAFMQQAAQQAADDAARTVDVEPVPEPEAGAAA